MIYEFYVLQGVEGFHMRWCRKQYTSYAPLWISGFFILFYLIYDKQQYLKVTKYNYLSTVVL